MKHCMKTLLSLCFVFLAAFALIPASKASAYGITQTGATPNSVTFAWEPEEKALNYKVSIGVTNADYQTVWTPLQTLTPAQTSTTISDLAPGTEYKFRVEYDYLRTWNNTTATSSIGTAFDIKTLPGKVTNVKQDRWYYFIKSFDVTWDEQSGVDGYEYIVRTNTGKKKSSGDTKYNSTNLSVNKISNNVVYTVQVRAYATFNGRKYYGDWSSKCYCFTQPRITSLKQSGSRLTVKWSKVKGATGYDVYVSTKPTKSYKKVKSVGKNTSQVTISKLRGKKLSSKKTYYVYIVTKKKVGKTTHKSGRLYYWNSKKSTSSFGYF